MQRGPRDPRELEAFLDRLFAQQMKRLHIPGAVVILVKDGKVFFTKGYGYADLERKKPVIPDKTLFRMGSVTKLFAATAVMQLVERGKLRLDDDVNKYLEGWQLEVNYPAPVTVANLLTHTGGFDDRVIGVKARRVSDLLPLGKYLAEEMPRRVRPPGKTYSYSNHGIALAGYLVEVASGTPFTRYVAENILAPLGMRRSSLLPSPALVADIAVSYEYHQGTYRPVPFCYYQIGPAGGLNATATDMAHFMIANLQNGRYRDSRILSEATAREMHRQHFTYDPRLPGVAYGFHEDFRNGLRAIWHNGGDTGYYCHLYLLPNQNLGLFFACNAQREELSDAVIGQFLDRYYPVKKTVVRPRAPRGLKERLGQVAGIYRFNTYSRLTIEKVIALLSEVPVRANDDGTLTAGGLREKWVEVEPFFFQQTNGYGRALFRRDDQGRVTQLCADPATCDRLPWYDTAAFHLSLIAFSVVVFLSVCAAVPLGYVIRRLRRSPAQGSRGARSARMVAWLVSILNLAFLLGLILTLSSLQEEFLYGVPRLVIALLILPLAATALTAGVVGYAVLAWKHRYWGLAGRVHYSLVALAAVAFIWFLNHWNLLGFRF